MYGSDRQAEAHTSWCFITLYAWSITFILHIGWATFLALRLERVSNQEFETSTKSELV